MPHVVREPGVITGTGIAVFLALVHAVNDVLTAILGALLPTLQAQLGATTTTLALLVAAFTVSSSVTQPILGALADGVGLRRVAAAGVALAAVSLSLAGIAGDVPLLLGLLVLGGMGSGALHPVSTSIVAGPSSQNPGFAVGLFTAGGMAGFAAGPVLVLYLVAEYGTSVMPWFMVPGLVLALGVLTLLPEWEPHAKAGLGAVIDRGALTLPIGLLTLASVLISLVFITFTSAVPLWLVAEHSLSPQAPLLGWTLGAFAVGAGLGAVAGGALAPRLGYARTAAASLLATTPPLAAILLVPPGAGTMLAAAVAGALLYASQPLLVVAAQSTAPQAPTAAAGVVLGLGTAIAGGLYVGSGALQATFGLAPVIGFTITLLVPAAVIAYAALRTSGRGMQES